MDDTSQKIIDATMSLIRDKGFVATTTKDIARMAGVNECTLFRKFKSKTDIVRAGVAQEKWRANITPEIFQDVRWDLRADLEMFMNAYLDRITPEFVNLSIGLRAPQLYAETATLIMKIPQTFLAALTGYFEQMAQLGKIPLLDFEKLAFTIFSTTFGYTFLHASFDQALINITRQEFIQQSIDLFLNGINQTK